MNTRAATLALLLVAFALRCVGLDTQELRGDEAFGYFFSLDPYANILARTLTLAEPHPIASYWLQHAWLSMAGSSEFALRFPSTWFSVVAVALVAALARTLALGAGPALVAQALTVVSPYTIWHAQDARMYSMSLALTLGSSLLAVRWWQAQGHPRWFLAGGYLLVTWLALHTHYFALYVVAAQNLAFLVWLWLERDTRRWVAWMGLQGALLLAWLPWLWAARTILLGYHGNGDSPDLVDAIRRAMSALFVGETATPDAQIWIATLALAVVGLGSIALARADRKAAWFLLVYALTPLAAAWLSAQNRPIFNERYLVAAAPPLYLLAAWAGNPRGHMPVRRWLGRGLIAALVLVMVMGLARLTTDPAYAKTRGWRELAAALAHASHGREVESMRLAQNYPDPTLWYYYRGPVAHLVLPPGPLDRQQAGEEVARLAASGVEKIVFVVQPAANWDPGGIAEDALRMDYTLVAAKKVAGWPVQYWLAPTGDITPTHVTFDQGLILTGATLFPAQARPGDLVEVYLRWQGGTGLVGTEAVSLQLLNAEGRLIAQSDRPLGLEAILRESIVPYGILLEGATPPGSYRVVLVAYAPEVPGAPRLLTEAGADFVVVGDVQVVAP